METKQKTVVVFGGTGHYGRNIVRILSQNDVLVRVLSRNIVNAKELLGEKVELIQGDVTTKDDVIKSLVNADSVIICLSAGSRKLFRKMKQIERDAVLMILEEAKKAGISRIVYLSGYEIREDILRKLNILKFGEIKLEIENKLAESNLNWTILGCSPSFELFFALTRNNKMTVPGGGFKMIPCISAKDVGEIAAQAVLRYDLKGMRLKLTGPEAMNFPNAAKRISSVTGKSIKHIAIPLVIINLISFLLLPFNPFIRFIFYSLKMLNNFPSDIAEKVPADHKLLLELFKYKPVTLDIEIKSRYNIN